MQPFESRACEHTASFIALVGSPGWANSVSAKLDSVVRKFCRATPLILQAKARRSPTHHICVDLESMFQKSVPMCQGQWELRWWIRTFRMPKHRRQRHTTPNDLAARLALTGFRAFLTSRNRDLCPVLSLVSTMGFDIGSVYFLEGVIFPWQRGHSVLQRRRAPTCVECVKAQKDGDYSKASSCCLRHCQ